MPAESVSPVSSVPEVFDRWRPGQRSEVMRSEFLDVLASVPDPRDPRGRRYSLMALLAIAVLATAAGMRGYAGFSTWAATAPDDVMAHQVTNQDHIRFTYKFVVHPRPFSMTNLSLHLCETL